MKRIDNDGFSVGYDPARQRAAWVAYRLRPIAGFDHRPRPGFTPDPRLDTDAPASVYAGPDYDRGHLAPNYAISQLYGDLAQRQTFYYSNIVPQRPRLNQLDWQRLEEIEIDDITPRVDTLWVLVGPVPGAYGAAPVAFFRIWLARDGNGAWQALAFRLPQAVRGDERLDRFIVSVDAIETATGLDFLPGLSIDTQRRLETAPADASTFGFVAFACQPARYAERWQGRGGQRLDYDRCRRPLQRRGNHRKRTMRHEPRPAWRDLHASNAVSRPRQPGSVIGAAPCEPVQTPFSGPPVSKFSTCSLLSSASN